jgi:threonine synthase
MRRVFTFNKSAPFNIKRKEIMSFVKCLKCKECSATIDEQAVNVCEFCFGPLEVEYDFAAIYKSVSRSQIQNGPNTMWRYHQFLPVNKEDVIDINTGFTPLIHAKNLGHKLGLDQLYIKNDSVNPTFSFKDRPVSVTATKTLEFGLNVFACVSTGNLMGSVAAHGAKSNLETIVFFPSDLEKAKINAAAVYGPKMVPINGTYDDANRFCSELSDQNDWAFVNINMRPYYAEGSKTLGYEVAEQLGWRAPNHCVVPGASGELYTKIWKGLQEFTDCELIEKAPTKMHLAQPHGCSPIVSAYNDGNQVVTPVKPNTIAKSLAIGNPASGSYSLDIIDKSKGSAICVPEEDIIEGIKLLAETEGIFTETAGGVVISSLAKLIKKGAIKRNETVVAFITGNGLKTIEAMGDIQNDLVAINPDIESFDSNLTYSRK